MSFEEIWRDEQDVSSEEVLALLLGTLPQSEHSLASKALRNRPEFRQMAAEVLGEEHLGVEVPVSSGDERVSAERRELVSARNSHWPVWISSLAAGLICVVGLALMKGNGGPPSRSRSTALAALLQGDFYSAEQELSNDSLSQSSSWTPNGPLRSSDTLPLASIQALEPDGYSLNLQPRITWSAPKESGPFIVRVEDSSSRVVFETQTSKTTLAYPTTAPALVPGQAYALHIEDLAEHAPDRKTIFAIVDSARREIVLSGLRQIEDDFSAAGLRHFAKARWFVAHRMRGLARTELSHLLDEIGEQHREDLRAFLATRDVPQLVH